MEPNTFQIVVAAIITLAVAPAIYRTYFGKAKERIIARYGKTVPHPHTGSQKPGTMVKQVQITNAAANSLALKFGGLILLGLPFIFGGSYVSVVAIANLTPTGHLYLWGTLGTIVVLIGIFAIARAIVKAALRSINSDLREG
jgi:hypothetical protein